MIYYICCIFPRKKNKVFCIMTHDASKGSNVGVIVQELKQKGEYRLHYLKKDERDEVTRQKKLISIFDLFVCKPFHMATSSYILQDNVFLPMAYLKFPKSVKVVQLWHGTGTIKKFGQSVNEGDLGELEKAADETITHLIVNGPPTRKIYQEAFGVENGRIYELGLPRTDVLFSEEQCERLRQDFYEKYPSLREKRFVLYAPTFRDDEVNNPKLPFDVMSLLRNLPEDMCIGLKLHPFVAKSFHGLDLPKEYKNRILDVSFEQDTNQLLIVSDVLITDYSSIIFEYCILRKPMLFYAYDYKEFKEHQRGFYEDYQSFVPGDVVYNQNELIAKLCKNSYDLSRIDDFVRREYRYLDGQAAKRIVKEVFG